MSNNVCYVFPVHYHVVFLTRANGKIIADENAKIGDVTDAYSISYAVWLDKLQNSVNIGYRSTCQRAYESPNQNRCISTKISNRMENTIRLTMCIAPMLLRLATKARATNNYFGNKAN